MQATICFMSSSGRVKKWSCLEWGGLSWRWDRRWGRPLPQTCSSAGLWPVSRHYLSGQWCVAWSSHHRRKWSDWLELVFHLTGACLWPQGFQIWPLSYPHVAMSMSECTVLCKKSCKIKKSIDVPVERSKQVFKLFFFSCKGASLLYETFQSCLGFHLQRRVKNHQLSSSENGTAAYTGGKKLTINFINNNYSDHFFAGIWTWNTAYITIRCVN